jgi:hypothetical protein
MVLTFLLGCLLISICNASTDNHNHIAEENSLHEAITDYFASWSRHDMNAYKMHFHRSATIYYIDSSGNPQSSLLDGFIGSQTEAHVASSVPLFELPTEIKIEVRGQIASAVVRWELHKGYAIDSGTDLFTFIKTPVGWKIVSLVFAKE